MYERRIENSMIKIMNELKSLQHTRELKEANAVVNQKSRCKMQNHNVKIKNSAYRPIKPDSVEDPGELGNNFAKQSQYAPAQTGANSFVGERYENKPRPGLGENKSKQGQFHLPPKACPEPRRREQEGKKGV
jgi:hypothetical protein